ncbi:cupin-like domain-containing protein [Myxococcaceae bacterium GXIMD 01537]
MNTVPRIDASDAQAVEQAMRQARPAVLTGLQTWPGAPSTWEGFVERYGSYPLIICEQRPGVHLSRALSELYNAQVSFLDSLAASNPGCGYYAMALPVKAPILEELRRPEPVARYCWRTGRTLLYVGTRGSLCHLHVDSDYSRGLHLVTVGRKVVYYAPPGSAEKLRPEFNLCGHPFHTWSREERGRFIREAGGYEVEISAGEAFYIPKNWWHQVEYLENSVGLSYRFDRTPAQNLLTLLVRQPINEILQLSETLEEGGPDTVAWAEGLLAQLATTDDVPLGYAGLVDYLERTFLERVPESQRYRSSLNDATGFDVLRRLAPPDHPRPVLRLSTSTAFDFVKPGLAPEALAELVSKSLADEMHDAPGAREAFAAEGWPWPDAAQTQDVRAMRLLIAGMRDHTRHG